MTQRVYGEERKDTDAEFAFSISGHCICCGGGVIATYEEYEKKLKGDEK